MTEHWGKHRGEPYRTDGTAAGAIDRTAEGPARTRAGRFALGVLRVGGDALGEAILIGVTVLLAVGVGAAVVWGWNRSSVTTGLVLLAVAGFLAYGGWEQRAAGRRGSAATHGLARAASGAFAAVVAWFAVLLSVLAGGDLMLTTERLILRQWRDTDREPFAAMNADPEVMEHFPATLSRGESDQVLDRLAAEIDERGWSFWALERREDGAFLGFTGISVPRFAAPFMPAVEIGWRLARPAWGHGYATEAARAALEFGFGELGLDEIVSFTAVPNVRSQAVMQRLGMTHDPAGDFDHPVLPVGHPLRRHVLFRLRGDDARGRGAEDRPHQPPN